jgi:hypothetical protein
MKTIDELVAALRVEIGLAPDDDTQDAWLNARVESVLAAMRNYTRRWLWPASQFRDAFMSAYRDPYCWRGAQVVQLAEIPVQEILSVVSDGAPQPADEYEWLSTGRLFRVDASGGILPVVVNFRQLLVDYVAGYVDLPADLYEVIAATVTKAWSTTDAGASSDALAGNIEKLTVFDVGSVELANTGGFYESNVKTADGGPILGPWAAQLDAYRDRGRGIGLPEGRDSTYVGAAPAAKAAA